MSEPPPMTSSSSASSASSSLQRPSLISGLKGTSARSSGTHSLPWNVEDATLRPVPPFYPPMNPRCTAFVGGASPSVVASRISECLRKRSISVEYDEESHTATCLTIDRVDFMINLYRGSRNTKVPANDQDMLDMTPDFSHGVIVECLRVRGDTISFHHASNAVCNAALGYSDGKDKRSPLRTSVLEYPRLAPADERPSKKARVSTADGSSTSSEAARQQSLERSLELLKKDRICAQQLGMQSLVALTDAHTTGVESAMHASLAVLGAPIVEGLEELHTWIVSLIQDRVAPGEEQEEAPAHISRASYTDTYLDDAERSDTVSQDVDASTSAAATMEDVHHGGELRARALRALCNALSLAEEHQPQLLRSLLSAQSPHLVGEPMLSALIEDLAGASRPPGVVEGTRLASAHEAALATTCLRILAEHSEVALKYLSPSDSEERSGVLEALERARAAGRASHQWLAQESEKAMLVVTQDVRTC